MAAKTSPYYINAPLDGIYRPVRQSALVWNQGILNPSISAKLYRRQIHPQVFAPQIKSIPRPVRPSFFTQYGRGKKHSKTSRWNDLDIYL
jgi:hypothetical protein